MNVSLPQELELFVMSKIGNGLYSSASDVVQFSLNLMRTKELADSRELSSLHHDIALGLKSLEQEPRVDWKNLEKALIKRL